MATIPRADRVKAFVNEYLITFDGTKSAIAAGYSPKTARVQGSQLLASEDVQSLLAAKMKANMDKKGVTQEAIIDELRKVAFFDLGKAFDKGNVLKDINEIDEETRAALIGVETVQVGEDVTVRKIRAADKLKALELLMRNMNMFKEDNDKPAVVIQVGYGPEKD